MSVKIVTDTMADIPAALAAELDITQVPCLVHFGDREFRDRTDLSLPEFYRQLDTSPILPFTSQPSAAMLEQVFRAIATRNNQILSIHVTGKLSGTLNSAHLGAQNLAGAQIEIVDSRQVSMAMGWMAVLAARAAKTGASLATIKKMVQDAMPRAHIIAMLDTLRFAQRGGRLGKGAALIGTFLNVKPLLSIQDGEVVPIGNVRTRRRGLERLVEILQASGPVQELAVMHAQADADAQELARMLGALYPDKQIIIGETGPVIGTHTGPGAIGIAWLAQSQNGNAHS
ncbi:MAG: DegV family protein [Chloroflexi bacterium]|nr:DegV family protein [Chloroflexota bacterium]